MFNDWEYEDEFWDTICAWHETSGGMWKASCGANFAIDHPPIRCPSCDGMVKTVAARYREVSGD